ncbi:MAG: dihydrofolate reductase [Ruminococcaceae bacterium]|nr:dihydrofolate reductase [Oscillospiraceae bacterium]
MSIAMIAAVGKNRELGKNNDLIWHFKEDMAFFKKTTTGSTVIMGRKTFLSLPRALPNRRNIVISRNSDFAPAGAETVASIEEAVKLAGNEAVFIIGGAQIYEAFLPLADTLYLTEIDDSCSNADTYFPAFDKSLYQKELLSAHCENNITFKHIKYIRI